MSKIVQLNGTQYFMLERLVELQWPVSVVLLDKCITKCSDHYLDLNNEQWILVKALHPVEVATTFVSCEKNIYISCVLPEPTNPASSAVLAAALNPRFSHLSFLDVLVAEDVKDEVIKPMEWNASEQVAKGNYTTTGTEPAAKKNKTALDFLLGENESTSTSATYNFNTAQ